MRYGWDQRRKTHSRIVENASYGLRQMGAEGLSVADLMKLAGLTHGGFYNHFDSRATLVGEAIGFAMDQMTERWQKLANEKKGEARFEALIADYVSTRHRDNSKQGCALPALAADIARLSQSERRAFAEKFEKMLQVFAELCPGEGTLQARQIATGAVATMVGAILLSRAVGTGKLSDDILEAGRLTAGAGMRKHRRKLSKAARSDASSR